MKRLIHYSRGRVEYTGRINRDAFNAWAEGPDGCAVLEEYRSQIRFALFAKNRALRRLWRHVTAAARSDTVAVALQRELDSYLARLSTLVFARDLPRVAVDLHRLVVVPRFFANAIADRLIDAFLEAHAVFGDLKSGRLLRDWFVLTVIEEIEAAVLTAQPSPKQPVAAGDEWIVVGVNDKFEWRVPFRGPAWPGHYYLLELTRFPVTRAIRKAAVEAIVRLEASLPALSRAHRNEIVRQAGLSIEQLLVRA